MDMDVMDADFMIFRDFQVVFLCILGTWNMDEHFWLASHVDMTSYHTLTCHAFGVTGSVSQPCGSITGPACRCGSGHSAIPWLWEHKFQIVSINFRPSVLINSCGYPWFQTRLSRYQSEQSLTPPSSRNDTAVAKMWYVSFHQHFLFLFLRFFFFFFWFEKIVWLNLGMQLSSAECAIDVSPGSQECRLGRHAKGWNILRIPQDRHSIACEIWNYIAPWQILYALIYLYTYKTHIQNIFLFIISPSQTISCHCLARKSCKLDDGFRFLKVAFVTGLQTAGPGLSGAPCVLCSELSNRIECRVLMGFGRAWSRWKK